MQHTARRRDTWRGLVALALVLCSVVSGPARAADPPAVVDVRPLAGSVVSSADAVLTARVVGDAEPTATRVTVDGEPRDHDTRAVEGGVQVTADLSTLEAGDHVLVVEADTPDGTARREWLVTTTDRTVERLAGADRHATAVEVSRDAYPAGGRPAAVLARGDDFADALAGAPLASHVDGPLLLTTSTDLPPVTAAELDRVLADDATVHLLGGPDAITADVADAVRARGHRVVRHAGADRWGTAAAVADELPGADTVVVASGRRFPDALAASVPAARAGWPVLLTEADELPAATADALARTGATRAVVVGGPVAVGEDVERALRDRLTGVERVAGETRFATAVAVARTFLPDADEVAVASGRDHPDALAAAARAADRGAPLLLVEPDGLPPETGEHLRSGRPVTTVVHGGPVAVSLDAEDALLHAVVDGPDAPHVVAADPASGTASDTIAPVVLDLDRPVTPDGLVASATLDGSELPATARLADDGARIVVDLDGPGDRPIEEPLPVHVVVRAVAADGRTMHHALRFDLAADDPVFATVGGLELVEPSAAVEVVGYHQSNHEGAQQMDPAPDGPTWHTMESRGRRTGSRTSADVVADEHVEVVSPVTGTVVRAGTYVLYCDNTDHFVAIEPDGMPGIEVKMLHFRGLRVSPGDRVAAGETVIGDGPRRLPFESQVDEYSASGHGPHVHVEVVDTSIPNVPNGGSGSDDC